MEKAKVNAAQVTINVKGTNRKQPGEISYIELYSYQPKEESIWEKQTQKILSEKYHFDQRQERSVSSFTARNFYINTGEQTLNE